MGLRRSRLHEAHRALVAVQGAQSASGTPGATNYQWIMI